MLLLLYLLLFLKLFLFHPGHFIHKFWIPDEDIRHIDRKLVHLLSLLLGFYPLLTWLFNLHGLTIKIMASFLLLYRFGLLYLVHHPIPVLLLKVSFIIAFTLDSLGAFNMAKTKILKLHLDGKGLVVAFAALYFCVFECCTYLLDIQQEIRV